MDAFDPAATLSPDDPLRAWLQQYGQDPSIGLKLLTDPEGASAALSAKGIPPPPHALAYDDPMVGTTMGNNAPIRTNPDGTLAGNITSPANPDAVPLPKPRPQVESPLDPIVEAPTATVPGVPLPAPRPDEAPPRTPTDISAKKKGDLEGATSDFAKTLSAVKALQPPAVSPVGTPSVRSPTASGAPNLASLLQVLGAQARPDAVQTLGRLLVAGKA